MLKITYCLFLLLASSNTFAKKTYLIGVQNFETYHPYSEFKNNHYRGFNRELLDLFAQTQGVKFKYKAFPIKRLYAELLNGNIDFKYPSSEKWALGMKAGKKIYYSQAVVHYRDGLIVKKENSGKTFNKLKSISVINGFTPAPQYTLAQKKGELQFIYTTSYQRLFELVSENRVDGAYFNVAISQHHISHSKRKKGDLIFDETLPHLNGTRCLSSIKHPEMILEFNQFLVDYKHKIDALKIRYHIIPSLKKPHIHAYSH